MAIIGIINEITQGNGWSLYWDWSVWHQDMRGLLVCIALADIDDEVSDGGRGMLYTG